MVLRPQFPRIIGTAPLAKGLVYAGLGGGAGTVTAFDASQHGNHGTLSNMDPASDWVDVPELGRKALDFDGSGDYVTTPNDVNHNVGTGSFSIAAWAKTNSIAAGDKTIWSNGFLVPKLIVSGADLILYRAANYDSGYDFVTDVWTHVAIVRVSGRLWWYLNGAYFSDQAYTVSLANNKWNWGAHTYVGGSVWNGQLSDFCAWNRALSENEIAALADPSNTLLEVGGQPLIWTPRAMSYFYAKAPAAGGATPWLYRPINSQTIGVCA